LASFYDYLSSTMSGDDNQTYDELYKVVLVGDAGVGKTNMLAYFIGSKSGEPCGEGGVAPTFHALRKPTIGVEFGTRIVQHPSGVRIKAQIWDTAGQERYRAITSSHYRRAAGALLCYDITSKKSYEHAQNLWLKELLDSADEHTGLLSCVMMVGNKTDLEAECAGSEDFVSLKQHEDDAARLGLLSARTSARTGQNVEKAFFDLIVQIYDNDRAKQQEVKQRSMKHEHDQFHIGNNNMNRPKEGCCGN